MLVPRVCVCRHCVPCGIHTLHVMHIRVLCMCYIYMPCHACTRHTHVTRVSQCETPGALGHLSAVVTGGTASFGGGNGVPPLQGVTLGEGREEEDDVVVVAEDGGQLFWGHACVPVLGGSPLATRRGFAHRACCRHLGPKHSRRPQPHHKGVAGEICPLPNPPPPLPWDGSACEHRHTHACVCEPRCAQSPVPQAAAAGGIFLGGRARLAQMPACARAACTRSASGEAA